MSSYVTILLVILSKQRMVDFQVKQHVLPIRVYYEDTDAGGIVYHTSYLKFCERGRTESLRALGFDLVGLYTNHDAQFVVRSAKLDFLQPARLDQLLYVVTRVVDIKQVSLLYNQRIHLESEKGPVLFEAEIRLACLDGQLKIRRLPEIVTRELEHHD